MLDTFSGNVQPHSIEDELKDSFLSYAMSVIVSRALPGRARRPEAGPPARALRDAGSRPAAQQALPQERDGRRRRHGQVPPARGPGDLRRAGAHGPGLRAPLPARGRPGELRERGRRSTGGDEVHRGPAHPHGDRDAEGHKRRHGGLRPELRREPATARGLAGAVPEPARQRL